MDEQKLLCLTLKDAPRTSLVVQWLRLHVPSAEPRLGPWSGNWIPPVKPKILHAATETGAAKPKRKG